MLEEAWQGMELVKSACFGLEHRICEEDGLVKKKKKRLNVWRPESLALF